MELTYDYRDKVVQVIVVKCSSCDGYNLVECIIGSDSEGQIIGGPYLSSADALRAGKRFIKTIKEAS